ncbi:MAG TPA: hypothetical protein PLK12_15455 [Prolixibacteraceae bacterium]|nr:hypothetical protein [Prolixibacteraceae bacterium]
MEKKQITALAFHLPLKQKAAAYGARIMEELHSDNAVALLNASFLFIYELRHFESDLLQMKNIQHKYPWLKLIAAEKSFNQKHLDKLLINKVSGYLVIESDLDDLDKIIHEVLNGHYCFSRNTLMGIKQTLTTNLTTQIT